MDVPIDKGPLSISQLDVQKVSVNKEVNSMFSKSLSDSKPDTEPNTSPTRAQHEHNTSPTLSQNVRSHLSHDQCDVAFYTNLQSGKYQCRHVENHQIRGKFGKFCPISK